MKHDRDDSLTSRQLTDNLFLLQIKPQLNFTGRLKIQVMHPAEKLMQAGSLQRFPAAGPGDKFEKVVQHGKRADSGTTFKTRPSNLRCLD
jgi:hypothetical protein